MTKAQPLANILSLEVELLCLSLFTCEDTSVFRQSHFHLPISLKMKNAEIGKLKQRGSA